MKKHFVELTEHLKYENDQVQKCVCVHSNLSVNMLALAAEEAGVRAWNRSVGGAMRRTPNSPDSTQGGFVRISAFE